jgi:hypothetical protein
MKKVCLFVCAVAAVQIATAQNVRFGLKGGVNISSANDEARVADAQVKPLVGYHVGGLAHIHVSRTFAVQPEVVYSKEGAKYSSAGYNGNTERHQINIPILAQYMFANGVRLQTGPQLGLVTAAKFDDRNGNEVNKNDIATANAAWAFGIGYLTRSGFGLDARFNLGLTDLYKDGAHPGQTAKSRVGQIGVFYQFGR